MNSTLDQSTTNVSQRVLNGIVARLYWPTHCVKPVPKLKFTNHKHINIFTIFGRSTTPKTMKVSELNRAFSFVMKMV